MTLSFPFESLMRRVRAVALKSPSHKANGSDGLMPVADNNPR